MTYTIVTELSKQDRQRLSPRLFVVVGCGGTGSFIAEGLCRLLIGSEASILLIDPDRVEKKNLGRQAFYPGDIGKFKAQALAERLCRQYGRKIAYSAALFESGVLYETSGMGRSLSPSGTLIIGCVDNAAARQDIARSATESRTWWLDAGNGLHSGQVLLGNTEHFPLIVPFGVLRDNGVQYLPAPHVQEPSLLVPAEPEPEPLDCAERVAANKQSPVINQMMAGLVLTFVHKLLTGTLTWMGAYIDLESGTLSTVDASPENVARVTGLTVKQLEYRPRTKKE